MSGETGVPSITPTISPTIPPTMSPSSSPTVSPSSVPSSSPSVSSIRNSIIGYNSPTASFMNITLENGEILSLLTLRPVLNEEFVATADVDNSTLGSNRHFAIANTSGNSFLFANLINASLPILSSSMLPPELELDKHNGSIFGIPTDFSDLIAYPITCISFPLTMDAPKDYTAQVVRANGGSDILSFSNEYRLFVQAYGSIGFVDDETGRMIGFREQQLVRKEEGLPFYPENVTQPYFCSVYWLGINAYDSDAYMTNIISTAFHTVRNPGQDYMIYTDNPAFSSYEIYLLLGAIPFWALTAACLLMYPSYVFLRTLCRIGCRGRQQNATNSRCGRSACCAPSSCGYCCCRRQNNKNLTLSIANIRASEQGEHRMKARLTMSILTDVKRGFVSKDELIDLWNESKAENERQLIRDEESTQFVSELDVIIQKEIEIKKTLETDEAGTSSGKATRGHKSGGSKKDKAKTYNERIDRILTSPPVQRRYCFLFVSALVVGCIATIIVGIQFSLSSSKAHFFFAADFMSNAQNASLIALDYVDQAIQIAGSLNQTIAEDVVESLMVERDRLARFATMSNPLNLRINNDWVSTLLISFGDTVGVEIAAYVFEMIAPVIILLSLVLASCTCRWNDVVVFENISICVGLILKGWLILCAALCWFILMFIFWDTAVASDACFLPSVLYVPVINDSQLLTEPLAYDSASNNYNFPPGSKQILANFFFQCQYQTTPFVNLSLLNAFNPYVALAVQADVLNTKAVELVGNSSQALVQQLAAAHEQIETAAGSMTCAKFGSDVAEGTRLLCDSTLLGNFLIFFFLAMLGIVYMIVIPCTDWIIPLLYRQWQANRVYEKASKETERQLMLRNSLVSPRTTFINTPGGISGAMRPTTNGHLPSARPSQESIAEKAQFHQNGGVLTPPRKEESELMFHAAGERSHADSQDLRMI